jgi:hypothetical protein
MVIAAALALLGLAAAAQPAAAANHDIHMTSRARIAQGESNLIQIDGVVAPPAEYWDMSWIEIVALPGTLSAECPGDAGSAGSIAEESGNILAIAMRPNTDEAGNFANSVSFAARAGVGPVMICGYLYDEVGYTWAAAMLRFDVVPAGATEGGGSGAGVGGTKPVSQRAPWVSYARNHLLCHAGRWTGASSYGYSWILDGSLRRSTKKRPFAPFGALRGHRVACRVTAYGPGGSASATSPTVRVR